MLEKEQESSEEYGCHWTAEVGQLIHLTWTDSQIDRQETEKMTPMCQSALAGSTESGEYQVHLKKSSRDGRTKLNMLNHCV